MISRRRMIASSAAAVAGGGLLLAGVRESSADMAAEFNPTTQEAGQPVAGYTPVTTPNGSTLPWKVVDGVKVGHLVAEPCQREFAPGLVVDCWGYNGQTPGPTIEAVDGDRLRLYVTNRLPSPTTVHWHGILLVNGMDGVVGLNQKPIGPGQTFKYEFTLRQSGTHMYHSHTDEMTQQAMGLMGMFVIHPRQPASPKIDRDFAIMLSEWRVDPGAHKPNPIEMTDFNLLTMNSKVYPGTEPLVVKLGQRVRIRFGNLGAMDHHPIHLHGYEYRIAETDGGRIPEANQQPANTVLVPVGATRAIEFVADNPGDWAFHCHMSHHMMNQMGHNLPNMLGVNTAGLDKKIGSLLPEYMTMGADGMYGMADMNMGVPKNSIPMKGADGPFSYIDMGGMFTILKVREGITTYEDPGWYRNPPGTVADVASADDLRRDGIAI